MAKDKMLDADPIRSREYRKLLDGVAAETKAREALAARQPKAVTWWQLVFVGAGTAVMAGAAWVNAGQGWLTALSAMAYAGFIVALTCARECISLRRRVDALQTLLQQALDQEK
ncbi:hypothetical protein [Chromobacterium subtsugae]|uniref:hypothetical protein n=1 Tax=Chromobacterium subtsugae TaxID=251747 RepID=UPI000640BF61|nr:hypothetical protein [Chromobacterium subtsugae]